MLVTLLENVIDVCTVLDLLLVNCICIFLPATRIKDLTTPCVYNYPARTPQWRRGLIQRKKKKKKKEESSKCYVHRKLSASIESKIHWTLCHKCY